MTGLNLQPAIACFDTGDTTGYLHTQSRLPVGAPVAAPGCTRTLVCIVLAVFFLAAHPLQSLAYTSLFAFGDSLTDTGRIPATPASNYYNGRYSNGSLWVEYLSVKLGFAYNSTNNYAFSGSTTSDLAAEISLVPSSQHFSNSLCAIWSGGNDFLDSLTNNVYDDSGWSNRISAAILNITNSVATLYAKGARSFLVCNLPDLGKIPYLRQGYSTNYQAYISAKVALYDTNLAAALTKASQSIPGLLLYPVDVSSRFNAIENSPATLGYTVTTNDVLDDPSLTNKSFTGPGTNYVFWDSIHPTTKTHNLISGWAYQALPIAPIVTLRGTKSGNNINVSFQNLTPGSTYYLQTNSVPSSWVDSQSFLAAATNQTLTISNNSGPKTFFRARY